MSAMARAHLACRSAWLLALGLAAGGCGESEDMYHGPIFEMRKPSIDWTLVWNPKEFVIAPPPSRQGVPSVGKAKVVELLHKDLRAVVEVYFVHNGAAQAEKLLEVIQRRAQRKEFRQGEPKTVSVGGRKGTASIASWRQRRGAPVQHCYSVRVNVGSSLWCFVATVAKESYEEAIGEFQKALQSVKFR